MMNKPKGRTPKQLRAEADRIERRMGLKSKQSRVYTFSHLVMGGIMMMFFVGVGLAVYVTIFKDEHVTIALAYIMELAKIVALGYFIKAFGENISKIVLSSLFGTKFSSTVNSSMEDET